MFERRDMVTPKQYSRGKTFQSSPFDSQGSIEGMSSVLSDLGSAAVVAKEVVRGSNVHAR